MADKKQETLERTYTVPLRTSFINAPPYKKTPRAVRGLREFLARHMKSDEIRLGQHLNAFLWQHGIKNPPARVKVHAVRGADGVVRAELEGKTFKESVKAAPKQETGGSLKDKLTSKLKGDDATAEQDAPEAEPKAEKPKADKPKAAPKKKAAEAPAE